MRKLSFLLLLLIVSTFTLSAAKRTVLFDNSANWKEVAVWIWSGSTNYTGGTWPGAKIVDNGNPVANPTKPDGTKIEGASCETVTINGKTYYKVVIDIKSATDPDIIFNNNNNGSQSANGVKMVAGGIYRGKVSSTPTGDDILSDYPDTDVTEPDPGPDPGTDPTLPFTIYYDNTITEWGQPYVYFWKSGKEDIGWAGKTMTKVSGETNLYSYKFTEWCPEAMIFNGGDGSTQSDDYETAPVPNTIYKLDHKPANKDDKPAVTTAGTYNGGDNPDPDPGQYKPSGTLPVLYINVYTDENKTTLNNEIIDINLAHKNYFSNAEYWLDLNGCAWMEAEGAASIGSKEERLPLEIKARGNNTRISYAKKPFKLKLGAKQSMLGLTKSKHFAIIAHADDNYGFMRNYTGFVLGKKMGLPWTPAQQPVEVVINGDYRGLYFLTESIRVDQDRVNITELADEATSPTDLTGGYLVELDNYKDDPNTIIIDENGPVYVTPDTPEKYSELQKRFITEQFTTMNNLAKSKNKEIWNYIDLDDAARYYLVEEIVGHWEAYHGSTYLFRDKAPETGDPGKWHFSPLWDFGHAFGTQGNQSFTQAAQYGTTWIGYFKETPEFIDKVKATWLWYMQNQFDNTLDLIDTYAGHIAEAAKTDYNRWNDQSLKPDPVISASGAWSEPTLSCSSENQDIQGRATTVKNYITTRLGYIKNWYGDYTTGNHAEPERDNRASAELPDYIKPTPTPGPDPDPETKKQLVVVDENNWGPTIKAYFYNSDSDVAVKWPGTTMTYNATLGYEAGSKKGTGAYIIDIPAGYENGYLIVYASDSNRHPADQQPGMQLSGKSVIFFTSGTSLSTDFTTAEGQDPDTEEFPASMVSGTLPVIYITVKNDDGTLNGDMTNKDYLLKDYHSNATYYMTVPENYELNTAGTLAKGVGSEDKQLPLEIKLRGNYTRSGFSKKPYKLKLGDKEALLGLTKSKHFALIAHADDDRGFMRNFVGFTLGKLIDLPWTPSQQPVELVINGQYRGLYFLTESIRVDKDRINITELADEETDNTLISGGYLVELDNYEKDAAFSLAEVNPNSYGAKVNVTPDTPEIYSDIQLRFVKEQFTAMNSAMGDIAGSDLWKYMDVYDAARYYLVKELIDDYESYHGSCYLYRDYGEGQKWHFSPLWDCGSAFRRNNNQQFLYENKSGDEVYGNTWIPNMAKDETFKNKLMEFWRWFMSTGYNQLEAQMNFYADQIEEAAIVDDTRWKNSERPSYGTDPENGNAINPTDVKTNPDIPAKLDYVKSMLNKKIEWLKGQWGSFDGTYDKPVREDEDKYMPLPSYASPDYDPSKLTRLYVADEANWSSNGTKDMFAYIYKDGAGDMGAWKGTKMTYDANLVYTGSDGIKKQGLYYVIIDEKFADGLAIVTNSDESKRYPANNVAGMALEGVSKLYYTGKTSLSSAESIGYPWSGSLPVIKISTPTDPVTKDKQTATSWSIVSEKGAESVSSIALEIKGRGSSTWTDFEKKPYKLKFDKKVALCGLTESKHFVLLPYAADAANGLLVNALGHKLSTLLGMDWTPVETPVELVINNDYKGLYFVVENVRPSVNRVAVGDYGDFGDETADIVYDLENDWLIELDNTADEADVIYTHTDSDGLTHKIVPSSPDFSDVKKYDKKNPGAGHTELLTGHLQNHVKQMFEAAEYAAAHPMSEDWREVFDTDQAIKFFVIQELMDDSEAYNTAFFMHHTTGEKWKLGPVWDFTGAFAAYKDNGTGKTKVRHGYNVYDYTKTGTTAPTEDQKPSSAIVSKLYANHWFRDDVIRLFSAFITAAGQENSVTPMAAYHSPNVPGSYTDLSNDFLRGYAARIQSAAEADAARWPDYAATSADNDVTSRADAMIEKLDANKTFLEKVWNGNTSGVENVAVDNDVNGPAEYFDLTGRRILSPVSGAIYIVRRGTTVTKELIR